MSQLQAIGLLLCGLAIALSVGRSIKAGRYGPIERADDPVAFWGIVGFFAAIVTVAAGVGVMEMAT